MAEQRLGADGTFPWLDMRHARADGEEFRGDRDGDAAALFFV